MLTYDTATAASLAGATSKFDWCNRLAAALGATRKLVCKSAAGTFVWNTATTYIDLDLTGAMTSSAGRFNFLGNTSNSRTSLAANLAVGTHFWRITSSDGTRWIQGTVGLVGSGADFVMPTNPVAGEGLAITIGSTIGAPSNLSMTGKAAPNPDASDAPYTVVIDDWSTGVAVESGRLNFNERIADLYLQQAAAAQAMGDVCIVQSTDLIVHDGFDFGFQLWGAGSHANENGNAPLWQITGFAKPKNWVNYPSAATFDIKVQNTIPRAFKVRILDRMGAQIGAIEWHDGPINAKGFALTEFYDPATGTAANPPGSGPKWDDGETVPRPRWNCGMSLTWQNATPSESMNADVFHAGYVPEYIRPTSGRTHYTVAPRNCLYGWGQINGLLSLTMCKEWPSTLSVQTRQTPADPYMSDPNTIHRSGTQYAAGYGFEPASITLHDWDSGPGGPRWDRGVVPSQYSFYLSDRNGVRPEGAVPWKTILHNYGRAYANHCGHWSPDPRTAQCIGHSNVAATSWVFEGSYYGGWDANYPQPRGLAIPIKSIGQGPTIYTSLPGGATEELGKRYNANGMPPWNLWNFDSIHHGYRHPIWHSLIFNSPMHILLNKFAYDSYWAGLLGSLAPTSVSIGLWAHRMQAWRLMSYWSQWVGAADHPMSYSQAQVEQRLLIEMEKWWEVVYKPGIIDNSQNIQFVAMRNLGCMLTEGSGASWAYTEQGGDIGYYNGGVLAHWKTSGLWDRVRSLSQKAAQVLDLLVDCLDKRSIDWILDTNGRGRSSYHDITASKPAGTHTAADVPASWAAWNSALPATGAADFNYPANGDTTRPGYSEGQFMRAQWAFMRKTYFPERPHPRVDAAIAKYKQFNNTVASAIAAETDNNAKRDKDYLFLRPVVAPFAPTRGFSPV